MPTYLSQPYRWHSRGFLPHFDGANIPHGVTFRLYDSVPSDVLERWKQRRDKETADDDSSRELQKLIEKYADAGFGSCFLAKHEIAELVQRSLLHFDGERYRLHAWVVMPNHVHLLLTAMAGFTLRQIMHSNKSFTSSEANKLLARRGSFWMEDYFDRYVRDREHYDNAVRYIERNPVKAGLCKRPEDWEWSSGSWRNRDRNVAVGEGEGSEG
jgi:REP element-mobilizing transposase RayT